MSHHSCGDPGFGGEGVGRPQSDGNRAAPFADWPSLDDLAAEYGSGFIDALRELAGRYRWSDAGVVVWLHAPTTYLAGLVDSMRPIDLVRADPDRVLAIAAADWGVEW